MLNASYINDEIPQSTSPDKSTLIRIVQALVRERLIPYQFQNGDIVFSRNDRIESLLVTSIEMTTLNRCIGFDDIFSVKYDQRKRLITLDDFFDCIYGLVDDFVEKHLWNRFCTEVKNHQHNMLIECHPSVEHHTPSLFYEQIVSFGHPFHPCSKTKIGFSADDIIHYCPEFAPEFDLRILAIDKGYSEFSQSSFMPDSYDSWFGEHYRKEYSEYRNELIERGFSPEDYYPIPCHPWQLEHVVRDIFSHYIVDNKLLILNKARILVSPTLSVRTVKPLLNSKAPYIKLPLNIQATSITRVLGADSIHAAPIISNVLENIFKKENNFNGLLFMLDELCGLHIKTGEDSEKQLGALYRRSADDIIQDGEEAMVVASLFSYKQGAKRPLLIDIMMNNGINAEEHVIAYFYEYAEKVITPLVTLSLCYGMTLEAHQQNTLVVMKNGHPSYFIARDFEGVNIYYQKAKAFFDIDLNDISYFVSKDFSNCRCWLLHTAYQCHLGEMILLLKKHFNLSEGLLWHCVAEITAKVMKSIKERIAPEFWNKQFQAILSKQWYCRSLLRMRLEPAYDRNGIMIPLVNPLASYDMK